MAADYDAVSTHDGPLSHSGPWKIKETLSFWLQLENALGLLAAGLLVSSRPLAHPSDLPWQHPS